MTLTTLLTAGGAAILHRVSTLGAIDLGFEPEGVSTTSTALGEGRHPAPESRWAFSRALLEELDTRGIPAATALNTPMSGDWDTFNLPRFRMRADAASEEEVVYDVHLVSPGYFDVMGIDLLAGRDFGPEDQPSSQRAVIVSEEFVDRYFPEGTPVEAVVGRVLAPLVYGEIPVVVGVARSTRHYGPDAPWRRRCTGHCRNWRSRR